MNVQQVLERFALIANLTLEESEPWLPICSESATEILEQVREGVDVEKEEGRLIAATSALSFYKYALYRAPGMGMESFSAGDISFKQNGKNSVQLAYSVWDQARASISDLLRDDEFCFERVVP